MRVSTGTRDVVVRGVYKEERKLRYNYISFILIPYLKTVMTVAVRWGSLFRAVQGGETVSLLVAI